MGVAIVLLGSSCRPVSQEAEPAGSAGSQQPEPKTTVARVGDRAPAFELTDLDGNWVKLDDYKGQVVLLNFWAVWCGPCRTEFPVIQQVYERYKTQGFVVLAVNIQESEERIAEFANETGLTFPVLLDRRGQVSARYRVRGLPTSLLVDREGMILEKHIGPVDELTLARYLALAGIQ
jgi:peroxiredoxin